MNIAYKIHDIILPIASIIMNLRYWWNKWDKWKDATEKMDIDVYNLQDVAHIMSTFKWTPDKYVDWKPWVHTIFANDMKDDCDGAAVLGKWLLGKIGFEARIVKLWKTGSNEGHSICVTADNTIMVSNNDVMNINPNHWNKDVRVFHRNLYDIVQG